MTTEETPQLELLEATTASLKTTCPKCFKTFTGPSALQALRMHRVRMHTRAGRMGAKMAIERSRIIRADRKRKQAPPSASLEKRRAYYRRTVNRYRAAGLTSQGKPFSQKRGRPRIEPIVLGKSDFQLQKAIKFCPHCGANLEKYL